MGLQVWHSRGTGSGERQDFARCWIADRERDRLLQGAGDEKETGFLRGARSRKETVGQPRRDERADVEGEGGELPLDREARGPFVYEHTFSEQPQHPLPVLYLYQYIRYI